MIIGHHNIIADLKKLADAKNLAHGYIFFGSPRVGKRLVAEGFANYLERGEFGPGTRTLSDAFFLEPSSEGAIGIDAIRSLREFLSQMPNVSPYRTAIVDGGEALTAEAQQAFLKIAEEPPTTAVIILIVSDPESLLSTLQSRFQQLYFGTVPHSELKKWLVSSLEISALKADALARAAHGMPGLAWAMANDETFIRYAESARQFLKTSPRERKDLIKDFVDDEQFQLDRFLEALLVELSENAQLHPTQWHRAVGLRRDASRFNLNPRLQLLALGNALMTSRS